jgi:TatA/E family protein of Tat protein translocase
MLSPSDTAIIFVVALLLFGPEQLPKLARQLGEATRKIQGTTQAFLLEMERAAERPDGSAGGGPQEPPRVP